MKKQKSEKAKKQKDEMDGKRNEEWWASIVSVVREEMNRLDRANIVNFSGAVAVVIFVTDDYTEIRSIQIFADDKFWHITTREMTSRNVNAFAAKGVVGPYPNPVIPEHAHRGKIIVQHTWKLGNAPGPNGKILYEGDF